MTTIIPKHYSPTREDVLKALGAVSETEYNEMWRSLDEKAKEINALVLKIHIMEKKLEIATETLKLYADDGNWCNCLSWNGFMEDNEVVEDGQFGENGYEPAQKALKEMEGVK